MASAEKVRINVYLTMTVADIQEGWQGDIAELEASIKATLHELIGDDGGAYQPHVLGIEVDNDG